MIAGLSAAGCTGGGTTPTQRTVRVAAAADLRYAFPDLMDAFQAAHPDIAVHVTYGSSGEFFAQISNGAPFDLFLSADTGYPARLVERGRGVKGTEFVYALGHLVVWAPVDSKLDLTSHGIEVVTDPAVRKVAIANPRHAPYGRAAEAALKHAHLYDKVKDRLVLGANVAQAAQFVDSGAADVGLIAQSLASAPPLQDRGRSVRVSADLYPPLEQGGIILESAKDAVAANALREFLTGAKAQSILAKFGFGRPGE